MGKYGKDGITSLEGYFESGRVICLAICLEPLIIALINRSSIFVRKEFEKFLKLKLFFHILENTNSHENPQFSY